MYYRRLIVVAGLSIVSLTFAKPDNLQQARNLSEVIEDNASSSSYAGKDIASSKQKIPSDSKESSKEESGPKPKIRVIKKADVTIEEYRFNNRPYMIKVTPKVGPPYYLYNEEGEGTDTVGEEEHYQIIPPTWKLLTW